MQVWFCCCCRLWLAGRRPSYLCMSVYVVVGGINSLCSVIWAITLNLTEIRERARNRGPSIVICRIFSGEAQVSRDRDTIATSDILDDRMLLIVLFAVVESARPLNRSCIEGQYRPRLWASFTTRASAEFATIQIKVKCNLVYDLQMFFLFFLCRWVWAALD